MTPRLPPWLGPLIAATLATSAALMAPADAVAAASGRSAAVPVASPVTPFRMVTPAALPDENWHAGHRGVDLAANVDQPVLAPARGTVTFAGLVVDRPVLTIVLEGGLRSSVEPVTATVQVGSVVVRGQAIGTLADVPGHCAPVTCMHWGVRDGDRYLDPLDILAGFGPVRLLEVS